MHNNKKIHVEIHILRKFFKISTKKISEYYNLSESNINTITFRVNKYFVSFLKENNLNIKDVENLSGLSEFKLKLLEFIDKKEIIKNNKDNKIYDSLMEPQNEKE